MDALPVTLIVKAPNQQIEDQTIQCELSWTINKLKQHLSEVYPSKPAKHEQKLIYSGQLLNDSLVLKDVLRQFDGQDTHTVHLVCTPKHYQATTAKKTQSEMSQNAAPTPQPNPAPSPDPNIPNFNLNNFYGMQWNQPADNPEQLAMQMRMMQAYYQYLAQYMSMANGANFNINPPVQIPNAEAPVIPPRDQIQNAEGPQQPLGGIDPRDQENGNRDWLDVFYMMSRIMVFVSFVYFYSSPVRFAFVVLFGLAVYLYQIGFFRNVNINNNNIVQGENGEDQSPSRLMVVWTFFTSFFTSLVPEAPNVI